MDSALGVFTLRAVYIYFLSLLGEGDKGRLTGIMRDMSKLRQRAGWTKDPISFTCMPLNSKALSQDSSYRNHFSSKSSAIAVCFSLSKKQAGRDLGG